MPGLLLRLKDDMFLDAIRFSLIQPLGDLFAERCLGVDFEELSAVGVTQPDFGNLPIEINHSPGMEDGLSFDISDGMSGMVDDIFKFVFEIH